jgi:hypothetical protein
MPKKSAKKPPEKTPPVKERLPPFKLPDLKPNLRYDPKDVERAKLQELMNTIWVPPSTSVEASNALLVKAIDMFNDFKVEDGIEGMMAVQMIGTHHAIVECFRRAMIPDQPLNAQKVYLSQAERLMGLYARHLAALDKHRGRGQQNITVKHVNVASGGQAIVGNIDTGQSNVAPVDTPPALGKPDTILPVTEFQNTTRGKVLR